MLAGVQASDLEALLEFVYRGEVSVDPNQLPSLLQAAHCLNIQGLSPTHINNESLQHALKNEISVIIIIIYTINLRLYIDAILESTRSSPAAD